VTVAGTCVLLTLLGGLTVIGSAAFAGRGVSAREERVFEAVNGWADRWAVPFGIAMQFGTFVTTPVLAGAVWLSGRRSAAVVLLATGCAAWFGAKLLKMRTRRGRPRHALAREIRVRGPVQAGEGFPSGHAATSANLAVVLGLVLGGWWWPPLLALALATALGRVYVGAHLPLDVVGGAGFGASVAGLGVLIGIVGLG
jgi:undecaprenyl-diphosphatase